MSEKNDHLSAELAMLKAIKDESEDDDRLFTEKAILNFVMHIHAEIRQLKEIFSNYEK